MIISSRLSMVGLSPSLTWHREVAPVSLTTSNSLHTSRSLHKRRPNKGRSCVPSPFRGPRNPLPGRTFTPAGLRLPLAPHGYGDLYANLVCLTGTTDYANLCANVLGLDRRSGGCHCHGANVASIADEEFQVRHVL